MPDPIFWCNPEVAKANRQIRAMRFNEETGEREPVIDRISRMPLMEKVPQRGHDGDSDPRSPRLARIRRWMHVLRHDGHEVRIALTNGAAPVEDTRYDQFVTEKARYFGWLPIGQCPAAQLLAGTIQRQHIVDDKVRKAQPCPPGIYGEQKACPHYLAERRARRELRAAMQAERDRQTETMEAKALRAQQATADGILELGRALMKPPDPPAKSK